MSSTNPMFRNMWSIVKASITSFIADNALSRGASIAFYAVTSIAPVLVIVIAIAGLAFGDAAAQGAVSAQLSGLIGFRSAEFLETLILGASNKSSGIIASTLGLLTLLVTASGVFGEVQSALNAIWKVKPRGGTLIRFVKARAASLSLVAALGFLMLASLLISAVLAAVGTYIDDYLPFGRSVIFAISFAISFLLSSVLFAAIYKILPNADILWRDVIVGAVATALLFEIGKLLIGLYLGSSAVGSSYGAAGGLVVTLLWIYYSAQIFLLGAEFTRAYAERCRKDPPAAAEKTREPHTGEP